MATQFDIRQLLQKPIAMMTGEELTFLLNNSMGAKTNDQAPVVQKRIYYGIEGIAQVFGCSVPTANRIKRSGILDARLSLMPIWRWHWQRKQKSTNKSKSNLWNRMTSLFVLALPIIR